MAARWATYRRFLQGRLEPEAAAAAGAKGSLPGSQSALEDGEGEIKDFRRPSVDGTHGARTSLDLPAALSHPNGSGEDQDGNLQPAVTADDVLAKSELGQRLDTLLEDVYCPLERWYLRSSLEKVRVA